MPFFLLLAPAWQADDYPAVWNRIDRAIRSGYYARAQKGDEMERLLAKYGALARVAKDRPHFEAAVSGMIGEFKDSHFALYTPSDQGYYLMDALMSGDRAKPMPEFGAWFRSGPEGSTVQMVLDGSEAERAGLRKGDVVTQLDGKPFSSVDSLTDKVGTNVTLTVRRGRSQMEVRPRVESRNALDMFLDATRESERVIDRGGRRYGYIHLWTQANDQFRSALAAAVTGKLYRTDGFILDLRDGFGGRPEGFADPFFRPEAAIDWKIGPSAGFTEQFGYQKPLAVLINGGSRSAKEVLGFILQRSRRAHLIGQITAGNVLGTTPNRIADWAYLEVPLVDVIVDGVRIEGRGVRPDQSVPEEFDSRGRDLDLAAALDWLSGRK